MYTYKAKLDRVIDGDTIDANIDLGFDITIHKRIRLTGIDTPESRTRDLEEKARGLASKARLIELLGDGDFILESREVGKFGRVLGTIYTIAEESININDTLVEEGYAVEYYGGKKKKKKEKEEKQDLNEDVPFGD
jgi:micrococcal nuclease